MAHSIEIERRFLIDGRNQSPWRNGFKSSAIKQYYLKSNEFSIEVNQLSYQNIPLLEISTTEIEMINLNEHWTSRIRLIDETAILTMKGKKGKASAIELEWNIELGLANEIINSGELPHIEKTRYFWNGLDGLVWEIDEFEGSLGGLILAEVELSDEEQEVELPKWLGMELTGLKNWSNSALAQTSANKFEK